jgi:hypothetical protein
MAKSRLVARDISEGLGKLPPQDLQMEDAVLGAIMLEKKSYSQVSPFLKPDHFYAERNKLVYESIQDLAHDSKPIDMRTVVSQLKKNGKLELVDGMYRISELTSAVSSSANIVAHARVIVEHAIKREAIYIASQIHQEAYDDTTSTDKLLEKMLSKLTFLKESSTIETAESRIKALWLQRELTEKPPAEIPLITIDGKTISTIGNHSLVAGKKKARKTLLLVHLIDLYFKQNPNADPNDIHIYDTEQGKSHVWAVREKIHRLTGHWIPVFFLRGMLPAARRDFITLTSRYWKKKPKICIIDGIRDLMTDINNTIESTEVIVWLEELIMENNIHLINVLHANKGDSNPRGHIGTELQNKAEITIELEKDEQTGSSIVKCESSRDEGFESFSFTHGENGLPEIIGSAPVKTLNGSEIIPENIQRARLIEAFESGPLSYTEAINELKSSFAFGKTKAESHLKVFLRKRWLIKSGSPGARGVLYKLMISTSEVIEEKKPEPSLFDGPLVDVEVDTDDPSDIPF